MNTQEIQDRIKELKAEQFDLNQAHEKMVAQFQRTVQANQSAYQQITGAITELQRLLSEVDQPHPTKNEHRPNPRSHTQHRAVVD